MKTDKNNQDNQRFPAWVHIVSSLPRNIEILETIIAFHTVRMFCLPENIKSVAVVFAEAPACAFL